MTSIFSWLNGISVLILVLTCFIFAVYFTIQSFKTETKYFPFVAAVGYLEGIGFSGILISFFWMLIGNDANEVRLITNFISYSTAALATWILIYIAFDTFFDPKYQKAAVILVGLITISFYISVYAFFPHSISTPRVPKGEILDDALVMYSLAWFGAGSMVVILMVFFCGNFYKIRKKTKGLVRKKATYLFIGYSITFIGCGIDMMFIIDYIFIVRFALISAFYFLYKGF